MSDVVIYHNPRCSKSRAALDLIREVGIEPRIIDYLSVGWTVEQLSGLARRAGLPVSAFLRAGEPVALDLGLTAETPEPVLLQAMADHPALVERAIVETARGVVIARPVERVRELL